MSGATRPEGCGLIVAINRSFRRGGRDEFGRWLELVPGERFARAQSGLHRESCPNIDDAEKFVDNLMGVAGAGPPSGRLESIVRYGVHDDFAAG